MRYPLHRSPLLWGALFVMAFTVWAWVDSRGMESGVTWGRIAAGSLQNGISATWDSSRTDYRVEPLRHKSSHIFPGEVLPPPFFLRGSRPESVLTISEPWQDEEEPQNLKELASRWLSRQPPQVWALFIPYWLVLLMEAGIAGGLIAWRARKWRKGQRMLEAESTTEVVG